MRRVATAQERLEEVQAAISAIVLGKISSYTTATNSVQKLSLRDLYELEDRLLLQVSAESPEAAHNYAQFARGGESSQRLFLP